AVYIFSERGQEKIVVSISTAGSLSPGGAKAGKAKYCFARLSALSSAKGRGPEGGWGEAPPHSPKIRLNNPAVEESAPSNSCVSPRILASVSTANRLPISTPH